MRTFTLYACSPGERIDVILPRIIEGVKATGETVYFTFNGKTAEVTENSTLKEIWGEFKRIDLLEAEANLMRGVRNLVHQWDAFNEQPIPDISNLPGKLLSPDEATEQPADGDDGKFVKISVRKEVADQFQKLGDVILAGQSSFIRAMNQDE